MPIQQDFAIGYYPDTFSKRVHVLGREKDMADALEAAAGYHRQYYGQCSPIMVHLGRKHIVTIPRRAA